MSSDVVRPDWDRLQRTALIAAAIGGAVFVVLAVLHHLIQGGHGPSQVLLSYMVAWNFWFSLPLGCLVLLMLQYLTGGSWGVLLRRVFESSVSTLLLLALLFLPVVVGLFLGTASPYPWIWEPFSGAKGVYLSPWFFIVRAAICFGCWLVIGYYLNRWSSQADRDPDDAGRLRMLRARLSGPGLVIYALTITLASVDWVMSLEPHWYSTIYPVLYATGQFLTALAFSVVVILLLAENGPLSSVVLASHRRALGGLLLTFIMFWGYMSISQLILIWVGNLPEEIPWYLRRTRGGWQVIAVALAVLHFAIPFLVLIVRDLRENARVLLWVAAGLLVLRLVDVFWWIEPAYPHERQYFFWLLDLAAVVGVGGLWVWWFLGRLRRLPLLPVRTPAECTERAHHD